MRKLQILRPGERLLTIERIFDSGPRSESWIYGFRLLVAKDGSSLPTARYLREKHIISLGGDCTLKAEAEVRRLQLLAEAGIPALTQYGAHQGAAYSEFLPEDSAPKVLQRLRGHLDTQTREQLHQLVRIGATLDQLGFAAVDFIGDLLFDQARGVFLYVDGGSDLGEPGNENSGRSKRTLLRQFPMHESEIEAAWAASP